MTWDLASSVHVEPTSASFQAPGPCLIKNSERICWLPGGRNFVKSEMKSRRLIRPPNPLVANPTTMSRVGKNARNKLNAMACEIMLHRGNTRANMRYARRNKEAAELIARHYTRRFTGRDVLTLLSRRGLCNFLLT